jgi:hypothetical protein
MLRTIATVFATLTLCATASAGASSAGAPVDADVVSIPADRDPEREGISCAFGNQVTVRAHVSGDGSPLTFAQHEVNAWFAGETEGDLILVLGADDKALWVLEIIDGGGGCDDCSRVTLREIGFDGRRREHTLASVRTEADADMLKSDRVSKRLSAWHVLSANDLRPVPVERNHDQRVPATGLSSWLLRVRDSLHGRTFVWRHRTESHMCWCFNDFELSTYVWAQP